MRVCEWQLPLSSSFFPSQMACCCDSRWTLVRQRQLSVTGHWATTWANECCAELKRWYAAPNARRSSRTATLLDACQVRHRHPFRAHNALTLACCWFAQCNCTRTRTRALSTCQLDALQLHTHEHNMSSVLHVHLELDRHCAVLLACLPFALPVVTDHAHATPSRIPCDHRKKITARSQPMLACALAAVNVILQVVC